jgi:hypothetical protein
MSAERFRVGTPEPVLETTHLPPVLVTYTRYGDDWWDADAKVEGETVTGFPVTAVSDLEAVRACAWTLLRALRPVRPVAEHIAGGNVAVHAAKWALRGGTTLAGPTAAR